MRFLLAFLLLLPVVVFAQSPVGEDGTGGGAKQQAPPPPKCKPSTLTWYARATEASKYKPSSVGYGLTIRNTYQGYIPVQGFRTVKVLQSPDKKFSVRHGDIAKSRALTLIWGDQLFKFTESNFAQSGMSGIKEMMYEYHYWVCIKA
ncbi:hypothetical protein F5H01DRAFT_320138 [Linnemannia elongata]|nr:hypothetical protein F5H01DRAFT_320138 [Linnemannia elongata]